MVGAIIGAVVAIGTAVIGGVVNSQDIDKANTIGLRLANIKRQDELKVQEAKEKMDLLGLRHQKNVFKFQKKEAGLNRKEREKDRQYTKRERFKADSLDFVNKNAQSRKFFRDSVRRAA